MSETVAFGLSPGANALNVALVVVGGVGDTVICVVFISVCVL